MISEGRRPSTQKIRPQIPTPVLASARASGLKLAASDEKNVSTSQSPTQTHPWLSGSDGDAGRAQRAQAPACQGPPATRRHDPPKTARLATRLQGRFCFRGVDRLHRRAEFVRVQRNGARWQTLHFVVYALRCADTEAVRLGLTVSRRVGVPVVRNRLKRRIRECFRTELRGMLPAGTALVIIARTGAGELKMPSIADELGRAAAGLGARLQSRGGMRCNFAV